MSAWGFLAVGAGAALGAWLRWLLGLWLNPAFPALPLGTLAANLVGGFLIGLAVAWAAANAALPPEARLFVITGFLGGLTTMSTFSAETTAILLRGDWAWGTAIVTAHVAGSILMTVLGMAVFRWVQGGGGAL